MKFSIALLATLVSISCFAAQMNGVNFPDSINLDSKKLILNGLGVRKATIFKVNVYVAGLFLETPSHNDSEILSSPGQKKLILKFVRNVGADKLKGAWKDAQKENCPGDCASLKGRYEQLQNLMVDMKTGDALEFSFLPAKVEVAINGQKKGVLEGAEFSKTLLSTWLGKNPPNKELKEGLLSKK